MISSVRLWMTGYGGTGSFFVVGWSGLFLFPCAYFVAVGGWFTGTPFVTYSYT